MSPPAASVVSSAPPTPVPVPKTISEESPFPSNSSFDQVLRNVGMTPPEIRRLIDDVAPVYNLARVRAGHRLLLERFADGGLARIEYDISDEAYLVIEPDGQGFRASRVPYRFDVREQRVEGKITLSLWHSLTSQGETQQLVMGLSNLFQWDIDFTSVQKGDSFSAVVEKRYREGRLVGYGDIKAARFSSGARDFYAFLFENPETGKKVYYDHQGKAVRKAFLKVPFAFDPRVTSGYSRRRFHPIHKRWRPHLGVDYGAPSGTPVLSSAAGRVVFAGVKGGFGKLVQVRHPNGFTTGYAHLSRILVRSGQAVGQSQQIGRVGATGTATGPHLDYRVQDRSGRYLNPRKMISWPSDKPVEERYLSAFHRVRDAAWPRLLPPPDYPQICEWSILEWPLAQDDSEKAGSSAD